jgi:Bacterial low temperature requirement A protein (LtrA)
VDDDNEVDADAAFRHVMAASAQRIFAGEEKPYDVGLGIMGELLSLLKAASYAGAAYYMWGFLTDGVDGPRSYARGLSEWQIEELMRRAAAEWLALGPTSEDVQRYFDRWLTLTQGLILLLLLWISWTNYTWLGNQARADLGLISAGTTIAMAAIFVAALVLPGACRHSAATV